jgi:hypothetical protein
MQGEKGMSFKAWDQPGSQWHSQFGGRAIAVSLLFPLPQLAVSHTEAPAGTG